MTELQRLRDVFRTAVNLPADAPVDDLHYQDNEKWDSLAHLSLIAAIEDEFSIMIDTDDVLTMSSFGQAARILGKYGVNIND